MRLGILDGASLLALSGMCDGGAAWVCWSRRFGAYLCFHVGEIPIRGRRYCVVSDAYCAFTA